MKHEQKVKWGFPCRKYEFNDTEFSIPFREYCYYYHDHVEWDCEHVPDKKINEIQIAKKTNFS